MALLSLPLLLPLTILFNKSDAARVASVVGDGKGAVGGWGASDGSAGKSMTAELPESGGLS